MKHKTYTYQGSHVLFERFRYILKTMNDKSAQLQALADLETEVQEIISANNDNANKET